MFEDNQYYAIPEFRYPAKRDKLFIDAGAFVGDSIEKYISMHLGIVGKVCGIELAERQYNALQIRLERLRKEWALDENQLYGYRAAVGDRNAEVLVDVKDNIACSRIKENEDIKSLSAVQMVKLDDLFHEEVSLIKDDIEGAELSMLRGVKI